MRDRAKSNKSILERSGFRQQSEGSREVLRWDSTGTSKSSAVSVQYIELVKLPHRYILNSFNIKFNVKLFEQQLQRLYKTSFGKKIDCTHIIPPDGSFWGVISLSRPGSREKAKTLDLSHSRYTLEFPLGLCGYQLKFNIYNSELRASICEMFGFGYVPTHYATAFCELIAKAMGDGNAQPVSLLEASLSLPQYIKAVLREILDGTEAEVGSFVENLPLANKSLSLSGGDHSTLIISTEAPGYQSHDLPISILETRELSKEQLAFDFSLLKQRVVEGKKLLKALLTGSPKNPVLLRRHALLGIVNREQGLEEGIEEALLAEPTNLLLLSYLLTSAHRVGNYNDVLRHASIFGELLMQRARKVEDWPNFEQIFTELLGDAWFYEDHNKAESCYRNIKSTSSGTNARVLNKLIHLSRINDLIEKEKDYLRQLIEFERRGETLARAFYRLACLEPLTAERIEYCLKSLHANVNHYLSALLAADSYIDQELPEKAIELLDKLIKSADVNHLLTARNLAIFETKIAEIWHKCLNRPEISVARLERAIDILPDNLETLDQLSRIYMEIGDGKSLVKTLIRQLTTVARHKMSFEANNVFRELLKASKNSGVLSNCFTLLCENCLPELNHVEAMLAIEGIDWDKSLANLERTVSGISDKQLRFSYQCLIAECHLKQFDARESAAIWLQKANALFDIPPDKFQFLAEHWQENRRYADLTSLYWTRIRNSPKPAQLGLILELSNFPNTLTDQQKDELAIKALEADNSRPFLQERLSFYVEKKDINAAARVLERLFNCKNVSASAKAGLLRAAVTDLKKFPTKSKTRDKLIAQVFRFVHNQEPEDIKWMSQALLATHPLRRTADAKYYAKAIISRGFVPDLPEADIEKLLASDQSILGKYHQNRAILEPIRESANLHTRKSIDHYRSGESQDHSLEFMLAKLCTISKISSEDLKQLESLVAASGNYGLLAEAYEKQAEWEDDQRRKVAILRKLSQVYELNLKNLPLAQVALEKAVLLTDDAVIKYEMIELYRRSDSNDQLAETANEFLRDTRAARFPKFVKNCIIYLKNIDRTEPLVETLLGKIRELVDDNSFSVALVFASAARECGLKMPELMAYSTDLAILLAPVEEALETASNELINTKQLEIAATLRRIRVAIARRSDGNVSSADDIFVEILRKAGAALEDKDSAALKEFLISAGEVLLDSNYPDSIVQEFFMNALISDRSPELRIINPLYFLSVSNPDLKSRQKILTLLLEVVRENPEVLDSTPFNVESIEAALESISPDLSSKDFDPRSPPLSFRPANISQAREAPTPGENPLHRSAEDTPKDRQLMPDQNFDNPPAIDRQKPAAVVIDYPGSFSLEAEPSQEADQNIRSDLSDMNALPSFEAGTGAVKLREEDLFPHPIAIDRESDQTPTLPEPIAQPSNKAGDEEIEPPSFKSNQSLEDLREPIVQPSNKAGDEEIEPSFKSNESLEDLTEPISKSADPSLDLGDGAGKVESNFTPFDQNSGDSLPESEPASEIDWRRFVTEGLADPNATRNVCNQSFANELEKHVAMQVVALINGNCHELEDWHYRVWQSPEFYEYPVSGVNRYPKGSSDRILHSPFANFVLGLNPAFMSLYSQRFNTGFIAKKMQTTVQKIETLIKPLSWDQRELRQSGFGLVAEKIEAGRYRLGHLTGLKSRVCYDMTRRLVLVDMKHYQELPACMLFHNVMTMLWAVKLRYYIPLSLTPEQMMPVIQELYSMYENRRFSRIKSLLHGSKFSNAVKPLNHEKLSAIRQEVSSFDIQTMKQLRWAMKEQVYRVILTETLDVIGLLSSLTNRPLFEAGALKANEIRKLSSYSQSLLTFCTKINFD
jgi:hypothetical protein